MKLLVRITFVLIVAEIVCPVYVSAQTDEAKELKERLRQFQQQDNLADSNYASTLTDLAYLYTTIYPDSAILLLKDNAERCKAAGYKKGEINTYLILGDAYETKGMHDKSSENYDKSLQLAKKINLEPTIALILNRIGIIHFNQGNYPEALSRFYEALNYAEKNSDNDLAGAALTNIANVQYYQNEFNEAESTFTKRLRVAQKIGDTSGMSVAYNSLGEVNLKQKDLAKALYNLTISYNLASKIQDVKMLTVSTLSLAEAYYEMDSLLKADSLFTYGLQLSKQTDNGISISTALTGLAKTQLKQGLFKEALANGLSGLQQAENIGQVQLTRDASETVSSIYEVMNDGNNALKYYKLYKLYSDSMNNMASQRAVAMEKAHYEFSKKENEFERQALQQKWLTFSAFAGLILLAVILLLISRNRNHLRRTNLELEQKNTEIENKKSQVETTLSELKATQAQLIQSEKMASLGELTAGIAHEIQNPLNFVNNFSEINRDIVDEATEEIARGNYDEVKNILNDIKDNSEKINHHGKRADAIVKGMLQHSRMSSGQKEPTDINALCDEYFRLSYHGLRAKDKSFNADFQTEFDKTIGKVNVVPQDIGRVLLNLYNNAFYAVNEKSQQSTVNGQQPFSNEYKPLVSVRTRKIAPLQGMGAKVEIKVSDNGNGIPQNIVDKIFQPFFTTKPTGQGTGLGLSLAYDIIKAHSGSIKSESKEGEGTTFIIQLPI